MTEADQDALCKRNSIGDGKDGIAAKTGALHKYDWGHGNAGDATARTNEVRFKRLEDEIFELKADRDMWKK